MLCTILNLDKKLFYYKGGEFQTDQAWKHRAVYHHGDYELIFCLKGKLYLTLNGQNLILNQHELLVVPPFYKMAGYYDSPVGTDFYWLHFLPQVKGQVVNLSAEHVASQLAKIGHNKEHQSIILPLKFSVTNFEEVTILIHQILAVSKTLPFLDERNYLTSALLIKLFMGTIGGDGRDDQLHVETIKEWIRAHINANLTVEEIALQNSLSPDYLTRLFKKVLGMTTLQYINRVKVETAKSLLIRTNLPIKEVAANSFFSDTRTFMRRFKALTGLTPSEYRHSNGSVHHNNPHIDPQIPLPKQIEDMIDYIPENGDLK